MASGYVRAPLVTGAMVGVGLRETGAAVVLGASVVLATDVDAASDEVSAAADVDAGAVVDADAEADAGAEADTDALATLLSVPPLFFGVTAPMRASAATTHTVQFRAGRLLGWRVSHLSTPVRRRSGHLNSSQSPPTPDDPAEESHNAIAWCQLV